MELFGFLAFFGLTALATTVASRRAKRGIVTFLPAACWALRRYL